MTYRKFHKIESLLQVLFAIGMLVLAATSVALAQEPSPAPETCKTAILIWVPIDGVEVPMLRADKVYGDRATCIMNKSRRESAAAILEFRASAAGALPPSRCAGVRETLAAEGVAADDPLMAAAAINAAYGENICPPDPSPVAGAGVTGGG